MDFKQTLRSDTSVSAIVQKLEEHHGATNCSWRLFTHNYSASNEVISENTAKTNHVTLAQLFQDIGQPVQESAPEYDLWYNYEPDERFRSDPILLVWPSN